MIITCSTCGHRGEDGKDYAHDCYWVFRERGMNKREAKRAQKEKAHGSDVRPAANVRPSVVGSRPDALMDAIAAHVGCPCGLGAEPWHWPRNGICSVGANMLVNSPAIGGEKQ